MRSDRFGVRLDPDDRLTTGGMAVLPRGAEAQGVTEFNERVSQTIVPSAHGARIP